MSGPKVLRIVTREEVEAICRREMAAVGAAAEELLRAAGTGLELREELTRRRRHLQELFAAGRFLDLQKQAPQMATFLRLEAARVEAEALAAAKSGRERRRRLADAATSLATAFPAAAPEMRELARRAMTADESTLGEEQARLDTTLRSLVARPAEAEPSVAQRELAARLGAGEESRSVAGWLAARAPARQPRDLRIDAALAEIEALGAAAASRAFAQRAAALLGEPEARQGLLADSLLLDVAAELGRRREAAATRARLGETKARLSAAGTPAAAALALKIAAALEAAAPAPAPTAAGQLEAEAKQVLQASLDEVAATARRQAVLRGLATLGYEVRDTLATAWVRDGRVVVAKPGMTDYAVELGAPADASRVQVRLVGSDRPETARSAGRDRDQEVIWCSELEKLRALVARDGGEVLVEKALEPGAAPVKTVAFDALASASREAAREADVPRRRWREQEER